MVKENKMKNVQAQYQDLLEGKMSKANFMRNIRMQFPQYVTPTNSFDDSVRILKSKRILTEEVAENAVTKKATYSLNESVELGKDGNIEKVVDRPNDIDYLNYYQVHRAVEYELSKLPAITDEAYVKTRKKVVDKIKKNPDAYRDLQITNYKEIKKQDEPLKMKEVSKGTTVDKANGMKKVGKAEKANTQTNLGKKEAKKAKKPKGVKEMPSSSKVTTLKEHILDEMMGANPHHESINVGSRVKRKGLADYDEGQVGNVTGFDGDTAAVKWDNGQTAHVQLNVLTKKEIPALPQDQNPLAKMPDMGGMGQSWLTQQIKEDGAPKHKVIAQLLGPDFYLAKKPESQWDEKDYELFNRLLKMAQETGKVPLMKTGNETSPVKKESKADKLKQLKEKITKHVKKEGFVVKTQSGAPIDYGKSNNQGLQKAKDLERKTGDQLKVLDTRTGQEKDV